MSKSLSSGLSQVRSLLNAIDRVSSSGCGIAQLWAMSVCCVPAIHLIWPVYECDQAMTAAHRVVGRSGWKPRHLLIEDGVWKVGPSLGGDR